MGRQISSFHHPEQLTRYLGTKGGGGVGEGWREKSLNFHHLIKLVWNMGPAGGRGGGVERKISSFSPSKPTLLRVTR